MSKILIIETFFNFCQVYVEAYTLMYGRRSLKDTDQNKSGRRTQRRKGKIRSSVWKTYKFVF
uniref:Candidate secreted effector n=1 Tax=Meloidogyne incognita TaxID=6306 RepID=A0A914MQL0_MELIC